MELSMLLTKEPSTNADCRTADMPGDLSYQAVYYMNGPAPKCGRSDFAIKDPPNAGWSFAFVIGAPDAKRVTLFCPFTIQSYQIPATAGELRKRERLHMSNARKSWLIARITENWRDFVKLGLARDYDVAAVVLTRLGAEVPTASVPDVTVGPSTEADGYVPSVSRERKERRGGKDHADALLRPVARSSKRGQVAEFFLGSEPRSVRECMARMDMSRNSVLSALHVLNKTHGLGYEVLNDTARVDAPTDWNIWGE
jgi:hypothetical protein